MSAPPAHPRARQRAAAPAQSEAQFQQAVIDLARALGWRCYHTHNSRHSAAGYPDLTLCRAGRLVFVELKREQGRVSDAQREWLQALALAGCECHVWRPGQWAEIEAELRRAG